jgi:transcriptional regulator with XRE-family HTH domain
MAPRRRGESRDTPATDTHVGPELKRLRTHAGLSLRTLAARAGFSASFLSLLEKGRVSPSIASLERIAGALGVTIVDLLRNRLSADHGVVRGAARPAFTSTWSRARVESLSGADSGHLEALAVTIAPSGTSGAHPAEQPRDQFAFQLKGSLTLFMGDRRLELKAGDAITIRAGTPHRWQNHSRRSAQVLLVMRRA